MTESDAIAYAERLVEMADHGTEFEMVKESAAKLGLELTPAYAPETEEMERNEHGFVIPRAGDTLYHRFVWVDDKGTRRVLGGVVLRRRA